MKGKFEYKEFRDFADKFHGALQQPNFLIDVTQGLRDNTLRKLKAATPKGHDSGEVFFVNDWMELRVFQGYTFDRNSEDLANSWEATAVLKAGDTFKVEFNNDVYYAVWVEEGHSYYRSDGSSGWIPGVFMMRNTMEELDATFRNIVRRRYNKYLRGFFD